MDKHQDTGPAQPDKIEQADTEGSATRDKDQAKGGQKQKDDDQPGAEGFTSAGASEDTYD